ncbi:hypothetical protein [Brevibacterium antiquum]|uniref:hypothetical protein n=1 Tax=Brevibacterium antiquum TaxID=234835 RepID=UPI0018DF773E|nr:hypothetical protein [Brevibacterium antiquum]
MILIPSLCADCGREPLTTTPMAGASVWFAMIACGRGGRLGHSRQRNQNVIVDTLCKTDLTGQSERKCLSMMRKETSVVEARVRFSAHVQGAWSPTMMLPTDQIEQLEVVHENG